MIEQYMHFRDRFADALDPSWQPIEELDEKVLAGRTLLWCVGESAMLTEARESPSGPIMHGLVCIGNMTELLDEMLPAIELWASENGCNGISFCGRSGWGRVMASHGFRVIQITALKEL